MGKDRRKEEEENLKEDKDKLSHLGSVPVSADAAHAEAVAAWRGRRVREHIEADRALELLV